MDGQGILVWFLVETTVSRKTLGPTQLSIQWVTQALSLGVKQAGQETGHSPPSGPKVKNAWNYISTPPYVFVALHLIN
jgi:hypothetical protein